MKKNLIHNHKLTGTRTRKISFMISSVPVTLQSTRVITTTSMLLSGTMSIFSPKKKNHNPSYTQFCVLPLVPSLIATVAELYISFVLRNTIQTKPRQVFMTIQYYVICHTVSMIFMKDVSKDTLTIMPYFQLLYIYSNLTQCC